MNSSAANHTLHWYIIDPNYRIQPIPQFFLFLISDIFAFISSAFVFYHLVTDRKLRNALHNHVLIIILFLVFAFELVDIPLHLQFLSTGVVRPAQPITCLIWWFIDWGFYYTIAALLVFASIERHILTFHSQLFATKRNRLIYHYFPLLVIMLLMMAFYILAIFAPICDSTFDYTVDLCGTHACYGTIPFFIAVEQIGFGAISTCLIAIFNMALVVRVVRQKYRIHRSVQWKKQQKLAVQMIALSLLFLIFSLPLTIVYIVRLFGSPDWADEILPIFFFLSYYAVLLLPYVCLGNLPDFWKKLKKCNPRPQRRVATVEPQP